MPEATSLLSFPWISASALAALAGAIGIWRCTDPDRARRSAALVLAGVVALLLAAMLEQSRAVDSARMAEPWGGLFEVDAVNGFPMLLYVLLALVTVLVAPRRDASGPFMGGVLGIIAASLLVYAGRSLALIVIGWWLTALPFALNGFAGSRHLRHHRSLLLVHALAGGALTAAALMIGPRAPDFDHASTVAMVLVVIAVALRKGIFPAHGWLARTFEGGSPLAGALFFNGHLGALILLRAESTHLAATVQTALHYLNWGALFTAVFTAFLMLGETKPRRMLGLLCVSQAAFILAGLCSAQEAGIAGALLLWVVVAVASTAVVATYRAVEARFTGVEDGIAMLGLAARTPRMAVFFLVSGLALVGLPGTLGYCAEDLLYHGALESEPLLGVVLLLATALNAIHLFRLFSHLFLRRLAAEVPEMPDALPRERWPLTLCVVLVVAGGLMPHRLVQLREAAAKQVAEKLGLEHGEH